MRAQTQWLMVLILATAVASTGCGRKRKDAAAENLDGTPDADTAQVDSGGTAEALPPVDDAKPFDDSAKAPPPEVHASGDMMTYSVQKGDTLMKIAFTIYGDIAQWKNLYAWNKDVLKKASQLEKGTQLKYQKPDNEPSVERNGDPYLIKKGDTLASIADDIYAKPGKWKKLWANNRSLIHNPNRIYAGFYLYYQITEQEKQLAEKLKANRPAKTAAADGGAAAPAADAAAVAQPDPANTGANAGTGALKPGGLSALAAPRAPASAPAAPAAPPAAAPAKK